MTVDNVNYLIGLKKNVYHENKQHASFSINIEYPMKIKLFLVANDNEESSFIIDIKEGKKQFKISLHHQDRQTSHGLLRIDFNGTHLNPLVINQHVPDEFKPFAGKELSGYGGHIHYHVDTYKALAWAIPVEFDSFPIKKIVSRNDYITLLNAFFQRINVITVFSYNYQPELL